MKVPFFLLLVFVLFPLRGGHAEEAKKSLNIWTFSAHPSYGASDVDEDGVEDDGDNCEEIANPDQEDLDGDGVGDLCDNDRDDDGYTNDFEEDTLGTNPDNWDTDGDHVSDFFDCDKLNPDAGYGDSCQLFVSGKKGDSLSVESGELDFNFPEEEVTPLPPPEKETPPPEEVSLTASGGGGDFKRGCSLIEGEVVGGDRTPFWFPVFSLLSIGFLRYFNRRVIPSRARRS